jgi:tetratricopeptide (TPR) repeat protein
VFRRLSVFAGGWTLDAAEAVCVGDGIEGSHVLDLLSQLVNKSLVIAERAQGEEARYRMLETIRQYAFEKLKASGEEDTMRRKHAEYYVGLIKKRTTAWIANDANRTSPMDLDNLRGALNWSQFVAGSAELHMWLAVGSDSFFWDRKMRTEVRGWLEGALAHADAERIEYSSPKAFVLLLLGEVLATQGDYTSAQARMTQSVKLFEKLGNIPVSAYALLRLGWVERERGDTTTARMHIENSLAIYSQMEDRTGIASATVTLGEVAVMEENTTEARTLLEASHALFQVLGDPTGMGWSLNHLGHVALLNGDYKHARHLFEESLPLFRQVNPKYVGVRETSRELGETALAEGASAQAMKHFKNALVLFQERGGQAYISWCLAGLAGVAALNEEPERAAWLWGAAEALRRSIGARPAPAARATRERLQAEVRKQLGEAALNAKWAEGQAASVEQAIDEALRP